MGRLPLLLTALLLALGGCADAVDPTLGTDQAFSLYGYLDPTASRQYLRVVPVTTTIEADTSRDLRAVVSSAEPATGVAAAWRDTVVTFADGTVGHIFVADYTPTPDGRVGVSVVADDGREASATVEIPRLSAAEVGPALPGVGTAVYPVTVRGVPRVIGGALRIHVTGVPGTEGPSVLAVPFRDVEITEAGGDWTVNVPFLDATRALLEDAGLYNRGLRLLEAEYIAVVTNAEWAVPPGGFDLDAIVEPGTFSNVAGGFGFVGSAYRSPVRWVPAPGVQRLAGFAVNDDPATELAVNEIGAGYIEFYNPTTLTIGIGGYTASMGDAETAVRIAEGVEIAPGGFFVVEGPFAAAAGRAAQLVSPQGVLLIRSFIGEDAEAWGAYPDGYSYPTGRSGEDMFYGPVGPSPGTPNQLLAVPIVINEVSAGAIRYVELVPTEAFDAGNVTVASTPEGLANDPAVFIGPYPFRYAPEGGGLVLSPLGGVVFLRLNERVVDVRRYGPAGAPDRTSGYLPDGPAGDWTAGLRRTRGLPNAAARFAL